MLYRAGWHVHRGAHKKGFYVVQMKVALSFFSPKKNERERTFLFEYHRKGQKLIYVVAESGGKNLCNFF